MSTTIKMRARIHQGGGVYYEDATEYTVDDVIAQKLIAQNAAIYVSGGPRSDVTVIATRDASGNVVGLGVGGETIALPGSPVQRNRLIFMPNGELTTHTITSGTHRTYRAALVTKSIPRRVRLIFANSSATEYTITGCAVSPSTNGAIDPKLWSASSSSWISGGSVVVPVRVAAGRPTLAYSAWCEIEAIESVVTPGTYPILVSAWIDSTAGDVVPTIGAYNMSWAESESFDTGIYHAHRWQDGDKFTVPSTFSETTARGSSVIIGWEIDCDDGITTVMASGDSITAGGGSTRLGETDILLAVKSANLDGNLTGYINAGWGGQNTTTYSDRLVDALSVITPDIVVYSVGSINDGTPTATVLRKERANLNKAMTAIRDAGAVAVLRAQAPNTSASWNETADNLRKSLNTWAASLANPKKMVWYAHAVAGLGDGAAPERFVAAYTTDNAHPNATGYAAAVVDTSFVLSQVMRSICH